MGLVCLWLGLGLRDTAGFTWFIVSAVAFMFLSILSVILCLLSLAFPLNERGYEGRLGKFTKLGFASILFRGGMAFIVGVTFFGMTHLHKAVT